MGEDQVAVHVRKDMLKSQMWRNSYIEEFLQDDLVHAVCISVYIYILFRFHVSPKMLFISSNYDVLFVCLAPMVFRYIMQTSSSFEYF